MNNKKIILDLSLMLKNKFDGRFTKFVTDFTTVLSNITIRTKGRLDAKDLASALFTTVDKNMYYGDPLIAYLLAKKFIDDPNCIDLLYILRKYIYSIIKLSKNDDLKKSINEKNLENDQKLKQSLHNTNWLKANLSKSLNIHLNDEEAEYLKTLIKDITFYKRENPITYPMVAHFIIAYNFVSDDKKADTEKMESHEESSDNNDNEELSIIKTIKIW